MRLLAQSGEQTAQPKATGPAGFGARPRSEGVAFARHNKNWQLPLPRWQIRPRNRGQSESSYRLAAQMKMEQVAWVSDFSRQGRPAVNRSSNSASGAQREISPWLRSLNPAPFKTEIAHSLSSTCKASAA